MTKIAGRANSFHTRANVIKATQHSGNVCTDTIAVQADEQVACHDNYYIGRQICLGIGNDGLADRAAIVTDHLDLVGIDQLPCVPAQALKQQ